MINIKQLISDSKKIYSYEEILHAINDIASNCNRKVNNEHITLLPVMKGALPFAGHIIPKLNFPLDLDYLHASRYKNNIATETIDWFYKPNIEIVKNRTVLLLDDILDEGITILAIKEKLLVLGASRVLIAVLFDKKINKEKPITADFFGLEIPNKYVFGFGLDFKGIGRNIPHLYAYEK